MYSQDTDLQEVRRKHFEQKEQQCADSDAPRLIPFFNAYPHVEVKNASKAWLFNFSLSGANSDAFLLSTVLTAFSVLHTNLRT